MVVTGVGSLMFAACGQDDSQQPRSHEQSGSSGAAGTMGGSAESGSGTGGSVSDAGATGDAGSTGEGGAAMGVAGQGSRSDGMSGAGGAGEQPQHIPTRWLAFRHSEGLYLYDLTKFPNADGLTLLGASGLVRDSGWSPDGQRFLYIAPGGLFVRDVGGETLGEPLLLADCAAPNLPERPVFSWIGDMGSAVCIRQQSYELVAFDPTMAAPRSTWSTPMSRPTAWRRAETSSSS